MTPTDVRLASLWLTGRATLALVFMIATLLGSAALYASASAACADENDVSRVELVR